MQDYTPEWARYKKLRNLFWFVLFGYVPAGMLIATLSQKLFHTFTPAFFLIFAWMIWFLVVGVQLNCFACPRCGQWFSGTWWYNLGFLARRCVHCKLPKYQLTDSPQ
jgi:hypothetical protein